jgi:hypothetical protein
MKVWYSMERTFGAIPDGCGLRKSYTDQLIWDAAHSEGSPKDPELISK